MLLSSFLYSVSKAFRAGPEGFAAYAAGALLLIVGLLTADLLSLAGQSLLVGLSDELVHVAVLQDLLDGGVDLLHQLGLTLGGGGAGTLSLVSDGQSDAQLGVLLEDRKSVV